uniref:Chromo domain-containing protein n=1 Tax=Angiostrongylus cantonensis TaxID=6313 RepID=A0A158P5S3_ANGCA
MGKKDKSRSARRTGSPIGEPQGLPTESEVSEEIYEVECIVAHRVRHGSTEYKVRWCGWSEEFDEWLDPSNMDCPEAVKEYWEKVSNRTGVNQQRLDIYGRKYSQKRHVQSSKTKRKLEVDTQHHYHNSDNAIIDASDMNGNICDSTTHMISDKNGILGQGQSKRKERKVGTEAAEVDMDVIASAGSTIHAANKEETVVCLLAGVTKVGCRATWIRKRINSIDSRLRRALYSMSSKETSSPGVRRTAETGLERIAKTADPYLKYMMISEIASNALTANPVLTMYNLSCQKHGYSQTFQMQWQYTIRTRMTKV